MSERAYSWEASVANAITHAGNNTARAEPGSVPRNNDRPVRFYAYHGTGRDTLTGFLDATLSLACFDEKCWLCRDEDCACACEHPWRAAA